MKDWVQHNNDSPIFSRICYEELTQHVTSFYEEVASNMLHEVCQYSNENQKIYSKFPSLAKSLAGGRGERAVFIIMN